MEKVLIVDDEAIICEGLRKILHWEDYGIDACLCAHNVREALDILAENDDIILLITDIKMPGEDGIVLLKEVKTRYPKLKCIVLSGYSDYSLVRTAMKTGAVDYLLKPVQVNDLADTISDALLTGDDAGEANAALFLKSMHQILSGELSTDAQRNRLEYFSMNPTCNALGVLLIRALEEGEACYDLLRRTPELCSMRLRTFPDMYGNTCVLMIADADAGQDELQNCVKECFRKLDGLWHGKLFAEAIIGTAGWEQIDEMYNHALIRLNTALIENRRELRMHTMEETDEHYRRAYSALRRCVYSNDREGLNGFLDRCFSMDRPLFWAGTVLVLSINLALETSYDKLMVYKLAESFLSSLQKAGSMEKIRQILQVILYFIADLNLAVMKEDCSPVVQRVQALTFEEYANPSLCLKVLAARLHMNAAYLGRLFHEEIGEFYGEYLARIRIHRAERMLFSTENNISEIASAVGFSSVNYFGRMFKKHTHMTPGGMRELLSKTSEDALFESKG
ncbi:MAG: response regulator [Clostridiales bacterium]|nr:response regulator [Clostridiales bacterium]